MCYLLTTEERFEPIQQRFGFNTWDNFTRFNIRIDLSKEKKIYTFSGSSYGSCRLHYTFATKVHLLFFFQLKNIYSILPRF